MTLSKFKHKHKPITSMAKKKESDVEKQGWPIKLNNIY